MTFCYLSFLNRFLLSTEYTYFSRIWSILITLCPFSSSLYIGLSSNLFVMCFVSYFLIGSAVHDSYDLSFIPIVAIMSGFFFSKKLFPIKFMSKG